MRELSGLIDQVRSSSNPTRIASQHPHAPNLEISIPSSWSCSSSSFPSCLILFVSVNQTINLSRQAVTASLHHPTSEQTPPSPHILDNCFYIWRLVLRTPQPPSRVREGERRERAREIEEEKGGHNTSTQSWRPNRAVSSKAP